nr:hypothetical protein [Agrobacterium tumefaciens]
MDGLFGILNRLPEGEIEGLPTTVSTVSGQALFCASLVNISIARSALPVKVGVNAVAGMSKNTASFLVPYTRIIVFGRKYKNNYIYLF